MTRIRAEEWAALGRAIRNGLILIGIIGYVLALIGQSTDGYQDQEICHLRHHVARLEHRTEPECKP